MSLEIAAKNQEDRATEGFTDENRRELADLRKRQVNGSSWSEANRLRLMELTEKEKVGQKDAPLSVEEQKTFLELTRRQAEGKNWTP